MNSVAANDLRPDKLGIREDLNTVAVWKGAQCGQNRAIFRLVLARPLVRHGVLQCPAESRRIQANPEPRPSGRQPEPSQ
jgi:hypothetical protein